MSWRDRGDHGDSGDHPAGNFGRPGGDWQGVRPSFDNPMSWALSLGRVAGIEIRVHVVFLIFIIVQLLAAGLGRPGAASAAPSGFVLTAAMLAILFGIVLLHEFGHCIGCRRSGGEANEILMWPLGGLAYCMPPNHWKAHLITAAGGPLVNVLICLAAAPMLGMATGQWLGVALPNPLNIFGVMYADGSALARSWPLLLLYMINALSLLLLLFNLLPIFPLDGGRIVQALLWPRHGYVGSMRFAVRTGFVGAVLLGIVGLVMSMAGAGPGGIMLVLIACFGGITCWLTNRQLQFTEEMMGYESDDYALSLATGSDDQQETSARELKREERRRQREEEEAQEVDRILAKIARSGMDSLTGRERRLLKRATEKKRGE